MGDEAILIDLPDGITTSSLEQNRADVNSLFADGSNADKLYIASTRLWLNFFCCHDCL